MTSLHWNKIHSLIEKDTNDDEALVETNSRFRDAYYLLNPDNGGIKHLWNVSQLLQDYTPQHPGWYVRSQVLMAASM
jgi:hypothetical protein